ncbi:unnamed protein product [Ilex paraguariensis]|uniref:Uncharacterized protein n=1 Tax=Ilex paraguariensis TaxID=185542 RepID=A0ABC8UEX5_9AQUA
MDSLLCNEVWLMSPTTTSDRNANKHHCYETKSCDISYFYTTKEDCEDAFRICLDKELSYMPETGDGNFGWWNYYQSLVYPLPPNLMEGLDHSFQPRLVERMELALLKALEWKLNCTTAFSYFELLTWNLVASKPLIREELTARVIELLLDALLGRTHYLEPSYFDDGRSGPFIPTEAAFSYFELLTWNLVASKPLIREELTARVIELLLDALLGRTHYLEPSYFDDSKFLEFRPCVIAISALRCGIEEMIPSTNHAYELINFTSLIPQDHQEDVLIKCHKIMEKHFSDQVNNLLTPGGSYYYPSSPVTVLTTQPVDIDDCHVDLSLSL